MNFIEIGKVGEERRFVNLDCVARIEIREDGSFYLELPRGPRVVERGEPGFERLREVLEVKH